MSNLTTEFKNSIFNDNLPLISEYIEVEIDQFIEEGILKDIPIVNSIISGLKLTKNVFDRNLLKQTLNFLNEFNSSSIGKTKLEKYREKMRKNNAKAEKELERVLVILNSNIDIEKSKILAKLFRAYIEEKINWNKFCEFTEITNRLFLIDLELLKIIWTETYDFYVEQVGDNFRIERIYSLGIIGNVFPPTNQVKSFKGRILNSIGKEYCSIIFS